MPTVLELVNNSSTTQQLQTLAVKGAPSRSCPTGSQPKGHPARVGGLSPTSVNPIFYKLGLQPLTEAAEHSLHLQNQKTCFHSHQPLQDHVWERMCHATHISPYKIMYGRECVMPWELQGDLGSLEDEEDKDLPIEEVIERIYSIREQVLDVAAASIKRAQKIQARS